MENVPTDQLFRMITKLKVSHAGIYSMITLQVQVPLFVHFPFHIAVVIYLAQGGDLVAMASSLFSALNTLKGSLRRIHESAPVERPNMSLVPIIHALAQNNNLCVEFFRRCVKFGEMVAASTGLLERAMDLKTTVPDDSVENEALSEGLSSIQADI
jgi:hypothetical protein